MNNKLPDLKELALIWSRSDVACMPVEEFADVTQTPMEDARVMFGAANALDEVIERLEAAEKRVGELEERLTVVREQRDSELQTNSRLEAELARRDKEAGEPVGEVRLGEYNSEGLRDATIVCLHEEADWENFPDGTKLYTAAPPAPSSPDYFGELVRKARKSAEKAMIKFPQPNYVLLKVAEEAGEVVQAGVHYAEGRETWEALEGEVVQTIAMLYRLVTEGDQVNGVIPPNPIAPGE